jgi:hypothetical protein
MCARGVALERISQKEVSNGHGGKSAPGNSHYACLNGQQLQRFLPRSSRNDPPCVRPSHKHRQHEDSSCPIEFCVTNRKLDP